MTVFDMLWRHPRDPEPEQPVFLPVGNFMGCAWKFADEIQQEMLRRLGAVAIMHNENGSVLLKGTDG